MKHTIRIRQIWDVKKETLDTTRNLKDLQTYNACGTMEKVWDELKKIEAQAEQIQNDAKDRAKQDAEKLVENSKTYSEAESQRLQTKAMDEANQERDKNLKASAEAAENLKLIAEKRMDKAVSAVVNAVLEDN